MYPKETLRQSLALYAVTDDTWLCGRSLEDCVQKALLGGVTFVQLREKNKTRSEIMLQARKLMPLCRRAGVPFVINDEVEIARAVGADGVHVGQNDMSCAKARKMLGQNALIGVSVQTVKQALLAQASGADYLGVGAVFGTPTKTDAVLTGIEGLCAICTAVDIPVVAIGGINASTVFDLARSGVSGVAVVSALFAANDIEVAARNLRERVQNILGT